MMRLKIYLILLVFGTIGCTSSNEELFTFEATIITDTTNKLIVGSSTYSIEELDQEVYTSIDFDIKCEDNRFCETLGFTFKNNFDQRNLLTDSLENKPEITFSNYSPFGICDTTYIIDKGYIEIEKNSLGNIVSAFDITYKTFQVFNPPPQFNCDGYKAYPILADSIKKIRIIGNFEAKKSK